MHRTVCKLAGYRRCCGWLATAIIVGLGVITPVSAQVPGQSEAGSETTVPADASVESLFVDFLHYARLGRFKAADAFATALLAHPDLNPVEVVELAKRDKRAVDTLLIIIKNSSIGENAAKVMDLIHRGEHLARQNTDRILTNIENLGGNPQQEYFAIKYLAESGEYAIPPMVQTLLSPAKSELWPRVINALTRMGKPAVTPLAMALNMRNNDVRLHVIRALGEIGYLHAVPHLRKLIENPNMPEETKRAAAAAIDRITSITGRPFPGGAADSLFHLGEKYYNEDDLVRADPRLDTAHVWYWDDSTQALTSIVTAERIFGQVMAMRCCQEVLALQNDHADATALWLAANIRREGRLGMNVESGDPEETGDPDANQPAVFPRALYFTQTAGAGFAHRVLARAVQDSDTAVALGAIEALRITAGESSLVGTEDIKQPLVQALRFPDALVRIRAALALGTALPRSAFADSQFVMPVLTGAVTLTGREQVLVVDPDQSNLNRVVDAIRTAGRSVIGETTLYRALERARMEFQTLGAMFISTDVSEPELATALMQFRSEFVYSKTPVVVLTKPRDALLAEDVAARDGFVELVDAAADDADLEDALARVWSKAGLARIDDDTAMSIAMEAIETLRRIAVDGRTVYDVGVAEAALISALSSTNETLQTAAASVLALIPTSSAQQPVAALALDDANSESLRLSSFASLSESAKSHGNLLSGDQVTELIRIARDEPDLTMRTAASQALGALNLAPNRASEIIRTYHSG